MERLNTKVFLDKKVKRKKSSAINGDITLRWDDRAPTTSHNHGTHLPVYDRGRVYVRTRGGMIKSMLAYKGEGVKKSGFNACT